MAREEPGNLGLDFGKPDGACAERAPDPKIAPESQALRHLWRES